MPPGAVGLSMWMASFLPFYDSKKYELLQSRCTRQRLEACLSCAASMEEMARASMRREEKSTAGDSSAESRQQPPHAPPPPSQASQPPVDTESAQDWEMEMETDAAAQTADGASSPPSATLENVPVGGGREELQG